jgi:hypothetical protein
MSGALLAQATTDSEGNYQFGTLPESVIRLEISKTGFQTIQIANLNLTDSGPLQQNAQLNVGSVSELVTVQATPSRIETMAASISGSARNLGRGAQLGGGVKSDRSGTELPFRAFSPPLFEAARASAEVKASAQELGELFEYRLKEPITIHKGRSALVPIVHAPITAEKVTVWNDGRVAARPQRALWLTNSSGLTLDGGSFSVLEEETFAGEGIFEPIQRGEKRLVSYATDLALTVSSRNTNERQRVSRVRINQGTMIQESEIRDRKTYTFRNEDTSPRTVIVEHPVRTGYELRSEIQPVESTAQWRRFRLLVNPKQTASLVVDEGRLDGKTYALTNLTADEVALFVQQRSIDKTIEDALQRILARKSAVAQIEDQKSSREEEMDGIFDDQQRLRENMKSLRGSAEEKKLLERYTEQLNSQETRLAVLRREIQQLETERQAMQRALDQLIQELSLDVEL